MVTHDQVIFTLMKAFPELTHGVDYWVGQEMDGNTQLADAKIYHWMKADVEQPTEAWIKKRVKADSKEYSTSLLNGVERAWRDGELARADKELLKAEDGDGVGEPSQWRLYRKDLRAYPDTEGFPNKPENRPVAPDSGVE
ncbi:hypothetical protein D3C80_962920 [compost metagenome]